MNTLIEEFEMTKGLEIDLDEGWHKNANRQFGGNPGRGFAELIQNLIDSYPESIPIEERKGDIETSGNSISIIDYGSGLSLEKVRLLKTLGGTDKASDPSKIGQFGIGFFSIFHKCLQTRSVVVTTRCEDYVIQITFTVTNPDKRPDITIRLLNEHINFSTKIEVIFAAKESVTMCLDYARKSLTWYPCKININGFAFESAWEAARKNKQLIFRDNYCEGFFKNGLFRNWITILCKYEFVMELTANGLVCGTDKPSYDLRDFEQKQTPYLPGWSAVVNCNYLTLTISRDSFYLNNNYDKMMECLNREFFKQLNSVNFEENPQLVLANFYSLQREIKKYLDNTSGYDPINNEKNQVIKRLVNARIFRITGSRQPVTILEIRRLLSPGLPLFYSPDKKNLRWLGGNFRHDFILLPERCYLENGASDFYKKMLGCLFSEPVNLDEIQGNTGEIKRLVDMGIVNKDTLMPEVKFVGTKRLTGAESDFLDQINLMLEKLAIREVIESNLFISVKNIRAVFFEVEKEGAYISTGLFDSNQKPISDDFITNFNDERMKKRRDPEKADLLLGLHKNHPLIRELIVSQDMHKLYYALTYIAHELVYCQKLLVPHSPFFHFVKEKLAASMRKALMADLIENIA